jgi:hypothetical protein
MSFLQRATLSLYQKKTYEVHIYHFIMELIEVCTYKELTYIVLGYDAMHNTDCRRAIDRFFVFKVQMIDPTVKK